LQIVCKNRINININGSKLLLDPKSMKEQADCIFISHGHSDHLPTSSYRPKELPPIVSSEATSHIFLKRKKYPIEPVDSWENDVLSINIIAGGHTFDSTAAVIDDKLTGRKIIYTGDVNIQTRAYLKGFKPEKCDILILEGTYGDKNYIFPSFDEQIKLAREFVQEQLRQGYPVALLGYSVGKAQLLNYSLGDLASQRFSHPSIWQMEQIHRNLGLELKETKLFKDNQFRHILNKDEPWLLFYPHVSSRNRVLASLRKKYNLKLAGFSGWARDLTSYKYRTGVDAGFVVSDHADFPSLLKIVRECDPEIIYTIFGDKKSLARLLQKEGYNAIPLSSGQLTLENFC
jgi:putative mRNA 3-end processing factor